MLKSAKNTKPCYAKSIVVERLCKIVCGGRDLQQIHSLEAVYVLCNHRLQMRPVLIQVNQY